MIFFTAGVTDETKSVAFGVDPVIPMLSNEEYKELR